MKWLKTTAYNNLSRNLTENPSLTSMKHKNLSARGHPWPFYHLKIHKISFPMVSESALGYLIPGLTQISSISPILYNLPARNITQIQNTSLRKKKCGVSYNQQNALIFSWYKVWVFPPSLPTYFLFSFWSGYKSKKVFLAHALTF